jgi:hypothetical protein
VYCKPKVADQLLRQTKPKPALNVLSLKRTKHKMERENRLKLWLKRLGVAGFLFFLIKGLVWIAIFVGLGKCAM